jgi:hypothetical protein
MIRPYPYTQTPKAGLRKGRIGDFFGLHATAAERPPGKLFERLWREFFPGCEARMSMVEKRS